MCGTVKRVLSAWGLSFNSHAIEKIYNLFELKFPLLYNEKKMDSIISEFSFDLKSMSNEGFSISKYFLLQGFYDLVDMY